jgi:apolipoprotein N-acyltransferase
MTFDPDGYKLNVVITNCFALEKKMNVNKIAYPQKDRWSFLWLVIGTLVLFFWRMPLAWWLAPVFFVRFMRTQNVRRGFLLIWVSGFLTSLSPMYTIVNVLIPTPLPVFLIITAVFALINIAVPYLVDRSLAPRLKGFAATLVFPLMMTIVQYIGAKANPLGSIGGHAYFQYSNLAFIQLLSITGMWGIIFLVNWLGPIVSYAWERGFTWTEIHRNVLIYAVIMLVVLIYGGLRLAYAPQAASTVRVHGITAVDMRSDMLPKLHQAQEVDRETYRQLATENQEIYLEATLREAQAGAQIIHWPEMAVNVPKEDEADFLARARQIAMDEGVYLVMAYFTNFEDGSPWENKLIIIDPTGETVLDHDKYAMVALEGTAGGDGILRTVDTPFGTLSGIICNDTNHEEVVAQAGKNGTDILFAPSMDYKAIDPIHSHMAMYRAIENGVTLVRQADNGLSIVVDPYGRVSATMNHWNTTDRVMVALVPIQSTLTLYPYIGDLFAWLAIAGFIVLIIWVVVSGKREKQEKAVEHEQE